MSVGSSLTGITFSGLSSGMDTDGIIRRMMAVEALPIQRMQQQQALIQQRMGVLQQFRANISSLATSAGVLNSPTAFNPMAASSSKTEVATLSASTASIPGTYSLSVAKLAQGQKIASSPQASASEAMNQTGQFVVNGKAITVLASDSLSAIAQKINSAGAGATASIVDGGAGSAFLTITSTSTGASSKIQISDLTGSVANTLGLVSGSTSIREPITNGALSSAFANVTDTLESLLGASGLGPQTIQINGVDVDVDFSQDSLQAIANRINATPGVDAQAAIRSVQQSGKTVYKLEITGTSGTPTFTDSGNVLTSLGVLQPSYGNELLQAQNAQYTLDGLALTSETNTITSAIPGATLTLLKANETTPETSVLTIRRDDEDIKQKIVAVKDAFNGIVDFIKQYSQFDKETFTSGPLFGDPVAAQIESQVSSLLFNNVDGLSGPYTNLTQIGFSMTQDGKLDLDETKLKAAIASDPAAVGALLRTKGESTATNLTYISSTSTTKPTGSGAYEVNITQLATKGSMTAAFAQTEANPSNETLTFNGALFGSSSYQLVLPVGSTLASAITQINSDSKLKNLVTASEVDGKLVITSKKFGTGGNFTVVSNLAASESNSGIGTTGEGVYTSGVDIAGTINGEPATGAGQFLTGDTGNAYTAGLQIQYTGNSLGLVGSVRVTKGIGAQLNDLASSYTDSVNGLLTSTDQALQAQVDAITESIAQLQVRLTDKEQSLRVKFANLEEALSRIQGQSAQMSAMLSGLKSG